MAKNIFVVTGSSRQKGNSFTLATSFIRGARSSKNAVKRWDAATKSIFPVRETGDVWLEGNIRDLNDDFSIVSPYINVSEVLVIATPVYFGGMSASIKLFIDKFYAYLTSGEVSKLRFNKAVLLVTASEDEEDTFVGVIHEFKQLMKYLQIDDFHIISVPNVRRIGDINSKTALNDAYELGVGI